MKLFSNYPKFLVLPLIILGLLITASLNGKVYASGFTASAPVSGQSYQFLQIEFHETAALADHSVKIIFISDDGAPTNTVVFADPLGGNPYITTMNLKNIADGSDFETATYNSLQDGSYTVRYEWQLADLSPVQHLDIPNVIVDTVTDEGTLISPQSNSSAFGTIPLKYTLPETPYAHTVHVLFHSSSNDIDITMDESTSHDGTINPDNVGSSSGVFHSSQTTIPDGTYDVTLVYQDEFENPANAIANNNFTFARVEPSSSSSSSTSSNSSSSSSTSSTSSTSSNSSSNSSGSSTSKSSSSSSSSTSASTSANSSSASNMRTIFIAIGIILFLAFLGILGWIYRRQLKAAWNSRFNKQAPPVVPQA